MSTVRGHAALIVVVSLTVIFTTLAVLIGGLSYSHYQNEALAISATKALLVADSALEEALLKLQQDVSYAGGTFSVSEGTATITVTSINATTRSVTVATSGMAVKRTISTTVEVTKAANPFTALAIFGGDDVSLVKNNSMLVGNLWTNDNIDIDQNTIVRGNVYAGGQGNVSQSRVRNGGRVEDNPATPEIEGNVYAIDKLRATNNGYIEHVGESKDSVASSSGGYIGDPIYNPSLQINSISVPIFNFNTYKAQAQAAGTYYSTPAQFLNYLNLNGGVITSGVHFIDSVSTLTFATGTAYNITGSVITRGAIDVYSTNYTHTALDNLPALAAKGNINFVDQNNCACEATVTGIVFSEQSVTLKHDQYTGAKTYAVDITGALWGGDIVTIQDHSRLTFDTAMATAAQGFNFDQAAQLPDVDNIVKLTDWDIQ